VIAALITAAIAIAVGWPWQRRLGEAYLLGIAACAGVLFVLSLLHIHWSLTAFAIGCVVLVAVSRFRFRIPQPATCNLLDLATLVMLAGYARFATLAPTPEYDFIGIWGVKAREFWFARAIDWRFLEHPFNAFAHVDYPILVPLAFDVQTLVAGAWDPRWLGMLNVLVAAAALLIVRSFLEEEIENRWLVSTATFAFVTPLCSPWIGLAEGPIVAYGTVGLLFIRRSEVGRGAVFLGLAAMCKNEGLTLIVAAAIAMMLAGATRNVWRLWPAAAIVAPWLILRSVHHLPTDLAAAGMLQRVSQHLGDLAPMFAAMAKYNLGKPLFWTGIFIALIAGARALPRERFLAAAIVIQLAFFIAAYLVTPHDVTWHVRWSWERIVTQLSAAILYLAFAVSLDTGRELVLN
jgi:hypothetical protein